MVFLVTALFGFHGVISNDTVWSDTTYLTGDVLVEEGVTLRIEPGTVVLYADSCEWDTVDEHLRDIDIRIMGNLLAIGTEFDSIIFYYNENNPWNLGGILLNNGLDSLSYCSFTGLWGSGLTLYIQNSEIWISECRFEGTRSILGENSHIYLTQCDFSEVSGCMINQTGGYLKVEKCTFIKGFHADGVIAGVGLDSLRVSDCNISSVMGQSPNGSGVAGFPCFACIAEDCMFVRIEGCEIDSIEGGHGAPTGVSPAPGRGGDGYGVYLLNCQEAIVINNKISNILGGCGGRDYENGGYGPWGTPRPFYIRNSNPSVVNNEFNSDGLYIYIDFLSHPIIGGELGKGNRFLNAAARSYVIYNNSPYDIDATWNFWECGPEMVDLLIFDYYDDSTKGIVYYDHSTDVQEEAEPEVESLSLCTNVVHDVLRVQLALTQGQTADLNLIDVSGRKVLSKIVSGQEIEFDVSDLARGVYFISVDNYQGELQACRIIIN